jgi:hypothetical protein
MGDGDHFGAEGDWSEDKERRLRDGITGIAKVVLDARDAALARAIAESDAEHVAMMQAEHDRRVEAEAEVRRLQGALRNLKRNALMCGALAGLDIPAWVDNLLAGREWSEGE